MGYWDSYDDDIDDDYNDYPKDKKDYKMRQLEGGEYNISGKLRRCYHVQWDDNVMQLYLKDGYNTLRVLFSDDKYKSLIQAQKAQSRIDKLIWLQYAE